MNNFYDYFYTFILNKFKNYNKLFPFFYSLIIMMPFSLWIFKFTFNFISDKFTTSSLSLFIAGRQDLH